MAQHVVYPTERIPTSDIIPADVFGAIYTGFRPFSGFQEQADELAVSHVRWPGGTLSEMQDSVYSLSNPEIFDGRFLYDYKESRDRPGLTDMFEYCVDEGIGSTIIIPTARYADDIPSSRSDVESLVAKIASGAFGAIPSQLTFEIGNEYYGLEAFNSDPARYGKVANELVGSLSAAISLNATSFDMVDIGIAVQMGRTLSEDRAIREEFSLTSLREIDALTVHSLPISLKNFHETDVTGDPEDAGKSRIERVKGYYSDWNAAAAAILGESKEFDLYVSAWSVGGAATNVDDVNLDFRDYGLKAAPTAIDLIWNYAMIGVDMASAWGLGNKNNNWFSFKEGGQNEYSPLGQVFGMMAETVPGMAPMNLVSSYSLVDGFLVHGFQDSDTLVFYVSALDLEGDSGDFLMDLNNLSYLGHVTARKLNATWREDEPIDGVQSLPVLVEFTPVVEDKTAMLEFTQDFQVIEMTIEMPKGINWNYGANLSQTVANALEELLGGLDTLSEINTQEFAAETPQWQAGFSSNSPAEEEMAATALEDAPEPEQSNFSVSENLISVDDFWF